MRKEKFKPGVYEPKNPHKFTGSATGGTRAVYRSSWELRVFLFLDSSPYIACWSSESVVINYTFAGKMHRYYVDVYFEAVDINGLRKKFLVEIKPYEQSIPPVPPKRMTAASSRTYTAKALTYQQNVAKWKAASKYAKQHGMDFFVLTERNASFLVKS